MANEEHLRKAFAFFDKNGSGFIEIEELRNALRDELDTNSEEVINAIMRDVDTDKVSSSKCYFCLCIYISGEDQVRTNCAHRSLWICHFGTLQW